MASSIFSETYLNTFNETFLSPFSGDGAFNPLDLNPILWLDASDTSSIVEVGDSVSQWTDLSGNGIHATQGTASKQPTTNATTKNGLNVIDFVTADSHVLNLLTGMFGIANAPNTVFSVARKTTAGNDTRIIIGTISNGASSRWGLSCEQGLSNSYEWLNSTTFIPLRDTATVDITSPHLYSAFRDGTSRSLQIDDNTTVTDSSGSDITVTNISVGAKNPSGQNTWEGWIAEILVFPLKLSDTEIIQVKGYLNSKWGL